MNQTTKSLNPCSLVMTREECFYCHKFDSSLRMFVVDRLYGMKACSLHYENAQTDIKSFMKKNKIIHIKEAIQNQDIKNFFNFLGDNMKIIRTNGSVDDGWKLMEENYDSIPSLKIIKGKWCFPVVKYTNKVDVISKMVVFSEMNNPLLGYFSDKNFDTILKNALNAIELIIDSYPDNTEDETTEYMDREDIYHCVVDDKIARVFIPPVA